jgi:hypothetical protein
MVDATGLRRVPVAADDAPKAHTASAASSEYRRRRRHGHRHQAEMCWGHCQDDGRCVLSKGEAFCCNSHYADSYADYAAQAARLQQQQQQQQQQARAGVTRASPATAAGGDRPAPTYDAGSSSLHCWRPAAQGGEESA